eukprot:3259697-Pyramimonas_sp.AAC.1
MHRVTDHRTGGGTTQCRLFCCARVAHACAIANVARRCGGTGDYTAGRAAGQARIWRSAVARCYDVAHAAETC